MTNEVECVVMCEPKPFAWATFNGEGGYDLRLYENNENYRNEYITKNGDMYKDWVMPLYRKSAQPRAMGRA